MLRNSVESVSSLKNFPTTISNSSSRCLSENLDPARKTICCPICAEGYEQELAKLKAMESEKTSSEVMPEAAAQSGLPRWLQNAKVHPTQVSGSNWTTNSESFRVMNYLNLGLIGDTDLLLWIFSRRMKS